MADKSNRDTRGDDYRGTSNPQVDREILELLRSKATDYQAMQKLKVKYPNNQDIVDKVHDAYKELIGRLYKRAKKFKNYVLDRYGSLGLTQGELIKKAKKYVRKLKLSDSSLWFQAKRVLFMLILYHQQRLLKLSVMTHSLLLHPS